MSSSSQPRPLTRASIVDAHTLIKPHIHLTPLLTSTTLTTLASTPQSPSALIGTPWENETPASPKFRLFFKAENFQRIGAFKVRGAFHAVKRLIESEGIDELRKTGVVTHSSGNHAQALALAAKEFGIPAHIVMPGISTPSKIEGTKAQGARVVFSGSTSEEREEVVTRVIKETGARLVPPYDAADIILGQGTMALELESQVAQAISNTPSLGGPNHQNSLHAVITPCGGGGMLSGNALAFNPTQTLVFGAEPSFQDADDARRSLAAGERIPSVKSLTIADGLRTPLGELNFKIVSDPANVAGIYAVTERNIRDAMRLVLERMKCVVEPSAVVGLAVILYNEEFRKRVEREGGEDGWNVGVVLSGGNTTVEAVMKIFGDAEKEEGEQRLERAEGMLGVHGERVAENVAG